METKITGLTKLFEQSIGIVEPWYIRSIEMQGAEVHVYVDIREGNLLPCSECGKMCIRAGYEKMKGYGGMETACSIRAMCIVADPE